MLGQMLQGKQGLEGKEKQLYLSREGEETKIGSKECKRVVQKLLASSFQVVVWQRGSSCAMCRWGDVLLPEITQEDAELHRLCLQSKLHFERIS